jgi:hypothetical protein
MYLIRGRACAWTDGRNPERSRRKERREDAYVTSSRLKLSQSAVGNRSERQLQRPLHHARRNCPGVGDRAEIAGSHIIYRSSKARMVERVERLPAKLQVDPLGKRPVLERT